jgi:hypothetical protein
MSKQHDSHSKLWAFLFLLAAAFCATRFFDWFRFRQELATVLVVLLWEIASGRVQLLNAQAHDEPLGPFGKIAEGLGEAFSGIANKRYGNIVVFGVAKGLALVVAKLVVAALFALIYSPWLLGVIVLVVGFVWMLTDWSPSFDFLHSNATPATERLDTEETSNA